MKIMILTTPSVVGSNELPKVLAHIAWKIDALTCVVEQQHLPCLKAFAQQQKVPVNVIGKDESLSRLNVDGTEALIAIHDGKSQWIRSAIQSAVRSGLELYVVERPLGLVKDSSIDDEENASSVWLF